MSTHYKILIVDDVSKNIQLAANILRTKDYNISYALSGKNALEKCSNVDFDLILLDIMMPEMDGFEVCEKLKSDPKTSEIPIIFLTAHSEIENIVRGFESGGTDYITKPFNSDELLKRVELQLKLKSSREELTNTIHQLEKANKTKDKLFSIIGHDLLGPLGNIKSSLEVITDMLPQTTFEQMQPFIAASIQSVGSACNLLQNLLYWGKTQSGTIVSNPKNIKLRLIVDSVLDLLQSTAQKKMIKIDILFQDELEVYADQNLLSTIIRNLIANAIKFTPINGKISINGFFEPKTAMILISIKDTGLGMNSDTLDKIFVQKVSFTTWGTSGEKGIGLGLSLCNEFISILGGKFWAESQPGLGSTFYFTIPEAN